MTTHLDLGTKKAYLATLEALNLTPFGKDTSMALGLEYRQLARLAAGEQQPSLTLQRLLEALIDLKAR